MSPRHKVYRRKRGKVVRIPYCNEISSTEIKNKILKGMEGVMNKTFNKIVDNVQT